MLADLVFLLCLFYGVVLGARRGFFKEVVAVLAVIVGVAVARLTRVPAGAALASKTGMPLLLAEAGGRFTDFDGVERADGGCGVATNGILHDEVLALVRTGA